MMAALALARAGAAAVRRRMSKGCSLALLGRLCRVVALAGAAEVEARARADDLPPRADDATAALDRARARARRQTSAEIRAAHRRLLQAVHPDHGGSAELTRRVNAARDLLAAAPVRPRLNFPRARRLGEQSQTGTAMTHRFDPTSLARIRHPRDRRKNAGHRRRDRDRPRLRDLRAPRGRHARRGRL